MEIPCHICGIICMTVIYFHPGPKLVDPDQTSNRINWMLDKLLKHLSLNKKNETYCLGIVN